MSPRFQREFRDLLRDFDFDMLERDPHSVFAVSPTFSLVYFNPAWREFAGQNQGGAVVSKFPLGANLLDALGAELRPLYQQRLTEVLATGVAWHHDYECSSALTFREFRQSVYLLDNALGLLLINSLKVEAPMASRGREAQPPLEARYLQTTGLLTQCSNCRRTLRNDGSGVWDWVPSWVSDMPENTSHGLCLPCFDYYWR